MAWGDFALRLSRASAALTAHSPRLCFAKTLLEPCEAYVLFRIL